MRLTLLLTTLSVLSLSVSGVSGCSSGSRTEFTTWVARWADAGTIPGIHQGSVELLEFGDNGVGTGKIVIWSDLPEGNAKTESSLTGQKYVSSLRNADGSKTLLVVVKSSDIKGSQGIVTVGDRSLNLTDGHVILISTQKGTPEVLQLELEPGSEIWKIVGDANQAEDPQTELSLFARSEKKVGDFFRKQVDALEPAGEQPAN
ncbi:MAG TPA: hypothetical protein VNQ76_19080 [Planctomicrobium sp.]|nr:hypothetical protein [Planctomicrobium sp.]